MDLTLQVLDAVQLPLAAALGGDAVFAAAADVVNELQLLWGQLVHLDEDLEVIARQVGDLVHGEGQLYLRGPFMRFYLFIRINHFDQVDFEWGLFCDYITLSHDPSSGCRPDVNVCMQTMHVSMFLKPKLNSLTTYTSLIILMSLYHIYHFQRLTCFCYIVTVLTLILSVH